MGLLAFGILALVPMAPAAAIQTIAWTTSPPASATVGDKISFAVSGTANTFLGARITGCFVNFPDGNNYSSSFGGNFTTGTCEYNNRTLTTVGPYTVTIGFTTSNAMTMTLAWTVDVTAPTPVVTVPTEMTAVATSVQGAPVTFTATATDSYYGDAVPTCTPASGSVFGLGTTTVSCSATNLGGKTGTASFPVVVTKATPVLAWSPPTSVTYGTTYGDLATAAMGAADATGEIDYTRADGTPFVATDLLPVGPDQVLRATYTPSGAAAPAYNQVTAERAVTVVEAASVVAFGVDTPTDKQYGDPAFSVTATGTPGGGVVAVTAQSGSTCDVSSPVTGTTASATVTLTGAGSCVLLADQALNGTHVAAPTAQWSVTVAKGNPQLTWAPPASLTYGSPVSTLLDATADVSGSFAYQVDGVAVAPTTVFDTGTGRVVSVVFTPDRASDYVEATASRTFDVVAAPQTLTVAVVADQTYGDAPVSLVVGGTGPGAVSASASPAEVCTVDGLDVTLVGAGDCSVSVTRAATSNFLAAGPVTRTFAVALGTAQLTWAVPSALVYGTPVAAALLNAAVVGAPSSGGAFAYTLADGSAPLGRVLPAGDHALTATWTPTDAGWRTLSKTVVLHVDRVAPVLTWAAPDSVLSGVALGDEQLDAVVDRTGSLAYTVDGGVTAARGQVLAVGDHVLHVSFAPADGLNVRPATASVPFTVRAVPVAPAAPTPPGAVAVMSAASGTVTVSHKGVVSAPVSCSSGTTACTATVELVLLRAQKVAGKKLPPGTVLATATYTLAPGTSGTVALKPTSAGRSALRSKALRKAQLRVGDQVRTVRLKR